LADNWHDLFYRKKVLATSESAPYCKGKLVNPVVDGDTSAGGYKFV